MLPKHSWLKYVRLPLGSVALDILGVPSPTGRVPLTPPNTPYTFLQDMPDMEAGAVLGFEPKPFYTPTELATLINVDPSTVMDWIHREELYAVKLGPKTYRIPLAAVVSRLNPDAAQPKRIEVDATELAADEGRLKRRSVAAR